MVMYRLRLKSLVQFGFEFGHRGLEFAFQPGDFAFEAGAFGLNFAFEASYIGFRGKMLIDAFEPRQTLFRSQRVSWS